MRTAIRTWEGAVERHEVLQKGLDEVWQRDIAHNGLDATGGARSWLTRLAGTLAAGEDSYSLELKVEAGSLMYGAFRLLPGEVESVDADRAQSALRALKRLETGLVKSDEIRELRRLHQESTELQRKLANLLEDIVLRGYLPGNCNWCPGERRMGRG